MYYYLVHQSTGNLGLSSAVGMILVGLGFALDLLPLPLTQFTLAPVGLAFKMLYIEGLVSWNDLLERKGLYEGTGNFPSSLPHSVCCLFFRSYSLVKEVWAGNG